MIKHMHVHKAHAGTDSAGYTWPSDGAVIAVPVEHALVLSRIPDGGFTIIETAEPTESAESVKQETKAATAGPQRTKADTPSSAK